MAVEGNEASFDLCSDVQKTNSSLRKSTSPRDNEEKAIQLKFLLSNAEAGSVIEKAGSTINEIHSQFGGHFQLSHQYEYFPGISDRIIMVSGTMNEVLKAVEHILSKLLDEFFVDEDGGQTDPQSKIRLLVPNSSCGGIIGVGGAIIRSLIEDSQAAIEITSKEDGNPGLHDRLVIVSGHPAQQMRAIELILLKLVEDPYYQQSLNVPILCCNNKENKIIGRGRSVCIISSH